jgi:ketosteroid isomerase-like protein
MRIAILFLAALYAFAADARQQLMEADSEFSRAAETRGLEGWMSWFADDAQINSSKGVVKGKAALREYYSKMFAQPGFSISWKPFFAEASKDGTLGYTMGVAQFRATKPDGTVETREGHYLSVWKKQPDGTYKVVSDMGN